MGQDTGIGLVEAGMVRRGFGSETPRSAEWAANPADQCRQTDDQKDEGLEKNSKGCCSRKEPDEDPKRRGGRKGQERPHVHLGKHSHLEAEEEGKQGSQERGVPAAMRAGCWEIHHEHAPMFHWRSEGDTPAPRSPSVPTGKQKAENCKSVLEAVPEASAWQAAWEARLLPLHPAANAEAGCYSELPSHVWSSLLRLQSHSRQSLLSPPSPANSTGNQKVLPIWAPHR